MNKKRLLTGLLLSACLLVMGASLVDTVKRNLPLTCDEIVDPRLNQIPKSNTDATTIQQWVANQYSLSKDEVFIVGGFPSSPPPELQVRWQSEGTSYQATIDTRSKQLKYIDVDWKKAYWRIHKPQLSQIIRCNNDPEYYTFQKWQPDPPFNLYLSLWYPQKGLIITAWNGEVPSINDQVEVDTLRLLGTFDINDTEVLSNTGHSLLQLRNGSIKKWSGLNNLLSEDMSASQ